MTLTHKPYFSLFWRRILLILIVLWGGYVLTSMPGGL